MVLQITVETIAYTWNKIESHWGVLTVTVTLSKSVYYRTSYWEHMEEQEKNEVDQKEIGLLQ